jgi:hypothetical protein
MFETAIFAIAILVIMLAADSFLREYRYRGGRDG